LLVMCTKTQVHTNLDKLEKDRFIDSNFSTNSHKNRFKMSSEKMQQLSQMLDANIIKICYENSIKCADSLVF
jgi:hypothetical protein